MAQCTGKTAPQQEDDAPTIAQNFRVAIALNNIGASFVSDSRSFALDCFSRALELTVSGAMRFLPADLHSSLAFSRDDVVLYTRSSPSWLPQGSASLVLPVQVLDPDLGNDENDVYLPELLADQRNMLRNAYVTPMAMSASNTFAEAPACHMAVSSVVLMFNVAVVLHRAGLEGNNGDNQSHQDIKTAQMCYTKVQGALADLRIPLACSSGHPSVDILIMAVYNNLGQISHYSAEFDDAKHHPGMLRWFCSTINASGYDNDTAHSINWHKRLFLTNAGILRPPTAAPSA